MGVAALVLGIVSILITLFSAGVLGWIGIILGIVGIVLAAMEKKNNPETSGMATAGLVLSIIGASLGLIFFVACMACTSATRSSINEFNSIFN